MSKSGNIIDLTSLPETCREAENLAIWEQILDNLPSNALMQPWTHGITIVSYGRELKPILPDGIDHNKIPPEICEKAILLSALGHRKWLEEWISGLSENEAKNLLKVRPLPSNADFWIPIATKCSSCGGHMRAESISQPYRYSSFYAKCADCGAIERFEMTTKHLNEIQYWLSREAESINRAESWTPYR